MNLLPATSVDTTDGPQPPATPGASLRPAIVDEAGSWRHCALFAITAAVAVVILAGLSWIARYVLLLLFGGLLLAVFLETLAAWVHAQTRMAWAWSLTIVLGLCTLLIAAGVWLRGPEVAVQTEQLQQRLPEAVGQLGSRLAQYEWARQAAGRLTDYGQWIDAALLSRLTGALSSAAAIAGGALIVLFVGCYVAAEPGLYVDGVVRLIPTTYRPRARTILGEVVHTLRWWLVAKVISMVVVAALVTTGLMILGIPLAWTLGGLAGVLTFIPNIGPILSVIPPLLLALVISPERALGVALLVWGVHGVEGFFVTPIAEQRAVKLPPALTIAVQLLLGAVCGALGVALAAPIAAAGMVLVHDVYIEDVLRDRRAGPLDRGQ